MSADTCAVVDNVVTLRLGRFRQISAVGKAQAPASSSVSIGSAPG
jgi:hypothetical protein